MKKVIIVVLALCALVFAQTPLVDSRDHNKKYKTVKMGSQVWMAENLNSEAAGGRCYGGVPENCEKYGRLYDWETAKEACPAGWHLPSYRELAAFIDFVGGKEVAGKKLKAKTGWEFETVYNVATFTTTKKPGKFGGADNYGFGAIPGGQHLKSRVFGNDDESFKDGGEIGYWWSSTPGHYEEDAFALVIPPKDDVVIRDTGKDNSGITYSFSVRCIMDTKEQKVEKDKPREWSEDE